jgi:hypothetical protein
MTLLRRQHWVPSSPDLGLGSAAPGTFSLTPTGQMIEDFRCDYDRMAGMITGVPPNFDAIMLTPKR